MWTSICRNRWKKWFSLLQHFKFWFNITGTCNLVTLLYLQEFVAYPWLIHLYPYQADLIKFSSHWLSKNTQIYFKWLAYMLIDFRGYFLLISGLISNKAIEVTFVCSCKLPCLRAYQGENSWAGTIVTQYTVSYVIIIIRSGNAWVLIFFGNFSLPNAW